MDIRQRSHLLIEDLSVARGERILLDGMSLRLSAGQIAEVTGPNGVGKSTLLRAIAGFFPLGSGRMSWVESEATDPAPLAERLHYVGHLDGLKSSLTARENLDIGLGFLGRDRRTPLEALDRMELAHVLDLPVGYLSAGQRRRVALARLLIVDRPLWLLDEPLTALDRHARALLKTIVASHLEGGGLTLAATHEWSARDSPSQTWNQVMAISLKCGGTPHSGLSRGRERRDHAAFPISAERSRRNGDAGWAP